MLSRYYDLCGDVEAFCAAAARPLPKVVWANPLRGDPTETDRRILTRCPEAVPVPWLPHAWRLPPETMPGQWLEHVLGLVHVQEEAALWAVPLLGAMPGETVLDACAAPGNKTAQLAIAMGDRGNLWAVDRSPGRVSVLRRTLERLGVTCAVAICADLTLAVPRLAPIGERAEGASGASVGRQPGGVPIHGPVGPLFDRVLLDVPCSCEGTSRKRDGRSEAPSDGERAFQVSIQRKIVARALARTRPGGTLIYSTCTYAPEENEGVLDATLGELAVIEPITAPPGLVTRPGIPAWGGRTYRPDVVHALRLWPQDNDTGGFFVARLRRL